MSEDTLQDTINKFFGDFEDDEAGCAVRKGQFIITNATNHAARVAREEAEAEAANAESLRRAIAQADDC
jgi:hypothetical protein